jgi:hypothetical protein
VAGRGKPPVGSLRRASGPENAIAGYFSKRGETVFAVSASNWRICAGRRGGTTTTKQVREAVETTAEGRPATSTGLSRYQALHPHNMKGVLWLERSPCSCYCCFRGVLPSNTTSRLIRWVESVMSLSLSGAWTLAIILWNARSSAAMPVLFTSKTPCPFWASNIYLTSEGHWNESSYQQALLYEFTGLIRRFITGGLNSMRVLPSVS